MARSATNGDTHVASAFGGHGMAKALKLFLHGRGAQLLAAPAAKRVLRVRSAVAFGLSDGIKSIPKRINAAFLTGHHFPRQRQHYLLTARRVERSGKRPNVERSERVGAQQFNGFNYVHFLSTHCFESAIFSAVIGNVR